MRIATLRHPSTGSNGLPVMGLLLILLGTGLSEISAGDWPQILGPQRNGHAVGETLHESWPEGGPPVLWKFDLGTGYSGPAVSGNRVVVFHRIKENERVEAIDARTGKSLWKTDFPAFYRGGANSDLGPRCVPLIHQGNIYVFGAAGDLHSVELTTGRHRWSRRLYADYRGNEGYFGAGSTPIVVDGRLLLNVGGAGGAGLVALSPETGKLLWKATDERASYSSPVAATIDNQQHVIFVTRYNALSINPVDGAVRFRFPFGSRGPTVNAATPLVFGNHLFVSASYGVGAVLAKIDRRSATPVWQSDKAMSSQYNTPVYQDGYIYGIHGREDIGVAELRCLHAKTGKTAWAGKGFGVSNLILADGKLLIMKGSGELVLARASPKEFLQLASFRVMDGPVRSLPSLSQGRFYVRGNQNSGGKLVCLQVGSIDSR